MDPIEVDLMASARVIEKAAIACVSDLRRAVETLVNAFRSGRKVLLCGNGGSAADAQHAAGELVVRLRRGLDGPALPAVALTTDPSVITAAANDFGYDFVFARQVSALGGAGDVLWLFTTSGASRNLIEAAKEARRLEMKVIAFTGGDGGELPGLCDFECRVPSDATARVQEAHGAMIHAVLEAVLQSLGYGHVA